MGNPELRCDPLPYSLVLGESVLNDAVAIVLFKAFMKFFDSGKVFTILALPGIMVDFTGVSFGSVIIGICIGLSCSYICKHTHLKEYPEYEIVLLCLFAYGSYASAELFEFSGIMSLFYCAIILSHYNVYNLSATSQITSHLVFKSLGCICEFVVFLYIGMGFFTGRFMRWNILLVVVGLLCCFIGRTHIFPFSNLANKYCRDADLPITKNMQGSYSPGHPFIL